MDKDLSFIKDLTPARSFWHMNCKIIKVWKQSYRWDLIVLDTKGSKIQACVKTHLLPVFQSNLVEDSVFIMRNFGVGDQNDRVRVIDLDIKINFFRTTTLTPVSVFEGHPFGFHFTPFLEITDTTSFPSKTVDVVGRLAWCGDLNLFKVKDRDCERISFELQDLDGKVLKCTFWDSYAKLINNFVSTNVSKEMVIIIIQHGRVKPWDDSNTVQNDRYATRVFLNDDLPEMNDLRRSLIVKDGPSNSQTLLSSQTVFPVRNEFLIENELKHIDELFEVTEEMSCVILATIKIFEEQNGGCYNACRSCKKKALTKNEYLEQSDVIPDNFLDAPFDSVWCIKCKKMATSLIQKFKLQFRVQDSTSSVALVMFDSEVTKLLGLTANDISERRLNMRAKNTFPTEFDVLKDRLFAFKIVVSNFNIQKKYHCYTIRKLTDDPEVIAELQSHVETPELSSINVVEGSQIELDSKDAVSYTDNSVLYGALKDSAASPMGKRKEVSIVEEEPNDQCSATKTFRRKLIRED